MDYDTQSGFAFENKLRSYLATRENILGRIVNRAVEIGEKINVYDPERQNY